MSEFSEIHEKLNSIIQLVKADMKLSKSLVDYMSNVSVNTDRRLSDLQNKAEEIKAIALRLDKMREAQKKVYTDEEIYKLKQVMSWNRLHKKTDIPLSTLQYRYRRYCKEALDFGGIDDD